MLFVKTILCACSSVDRAVASDAMCAGSIPVRRTISSWLNWWHVQKSPKYWAFLLPKSRNFYFDFHRWHWAVLAMCKDLNSQKCKFNPLQRSKYRQISILSVKNSIQSFGLGFSGFHEMWKHRNRALFCFPENQVIENLSAICEPFLTASVVARDTTLPRMTKAVVNDFWGSCGRYIESRSRLLSMK